MARNQFTFYRSFWENIERLQTNKEKLQAYQLLCSYAFEKYEPDLDAVKPCAATVFRIAKPVLDTAHSRAEKLLRNLERKQLASIIIHDPAQQDKEKDKDKYIGIDKY